MSRRSAIQTGVCGGLGLSLAEMLRLEAADSSAFTQATGTKKEAQALSIIQLHLPGWISAAGVSGPQAGSACGYPWVVWRDSNENWRCAQ